MADKYLSVTTAGQMQEIEATVTSAGAGNANDIVALDAAGRLDASVLPAGVGVDEKNYEFTETATEGDLLNIFDDAGTAKVRLADATNGRDAHCFSTTAVTSGGTGNVRFEGELSGLTGLTIGANYYLSATAGEATAVAPTTAGHRVQQIGIARDATTLDFEPQRSIVRA
jgi:hypothetical protein